MTRSFCFLIAFAITMVWLSPSCLFAQPGNEISTPPQLMSRIKITYPEAAKAKRIEGKVWLSLLIDSTGKVEQIKIDRSDNMLLNQAAIDAMRNAQFAPATYNGIAEKVWYQQSLTFKLSASDTATTVVHPPRNSPPVPLVPLNQLFTYPLDALAAGIEGVVELEAIIDTNGKVEKSEILYSSLPSFEAAALVAIERASFQPAVEAGAKVRAIYKQTLRFILPKTNVDKVVGLDSSITAAPELLQEPPMIFSMKASKPTTTTIRVLVGPNGVVKNVLALDKNVDASTLATVLQAGYKLSFAPGMIKDKIAQLWTDVTFNVMPLK
ncbi:MAG TPA: energy transducer TonB [Candidatus Kapabacteria bacterium]|nr:energy transducer TonB [Candidatus Kapabacteria bacterium]